MVKVLICNVRSSVIGHLPQNKWHRIRTKILYMRLDMLVYGIFNTRTAFVAAIERLKSEGFSSSHVSVFLPPFGGEKDFVAMIDALMNKGMPEYEALHFARLIADGGMLISIHSGQDERDDIAIEILQDYGAHEISTSSIEKKSLFSIKSQSYFNKFSF